MSNPSRRSLLRSGATLGMLALPGCSVLGGDSADSEPSNRSDGNATPSPNGTDGNASDPDDDPGSSPTIDRWPQYQYDAQNSGSVAASGPTENVEEVWDHTLEAEIHASPVVADGKVYVADRSGKVHAFGTGDGSEEWETDLDAAIDATPAISESFVIVPTHEAIHGLDPSTGDTRWRTSVEGAPSDLTLYDGGVAFSVEDVGVRMLEVSGGTDRWLVDGESSAQTFLDGIAVAGGYLYTNDRSNSEDEDQGNDDDDFVYRIDPEDESGVAYKRLLDGLNTSPGSDGDILAFGGESGIYVFRSDDNIGMVWERLLNSSVSVTPCVTGQYVAFNTVTDIYVSDIDTGNILWTTETGLFGVRGEIILGEHIFYCDEYAGASCYDLESGEQRWIRSCEGDYCYTTDIDTAYPRPAFANGRLIVCGVDGTVRVFASE